jgi:hypothetical protein
MVPFTPFKGIQVVSNSPATEIIAAVSTKLEQIQSSCERTVKCFHRLVVTTLQETLLDMQKVPASANL